MHSLRILLSRDLNTGMVFLRVRPRLMTKGGESTDHLPITKRYLKNGIQIDWHKSHLYQSTLMDEMAT